MLVRVKSWFSKDMLRLTTSAVESVFQSAGDGGLFLTHLGGPPLTTILVSMETMPGYLFQITKEPLQGGGTNLSFRVWQDAKDVGLASAWRCPERMD